MNAPSKFNIEAVLASHPPRTNFNVIRLDEQYNVRVATIAGRFPWHRHTKGDEGWLVWKGRLRIDIEGAPSVELAAGEGTRIPRGTVHSPICLEEGTIVIVFNAAGFDHEYREPQPEVGAFLEKDL